MPLPTDHRDPEERERDRRSSAPAVSPWVIVGLILILGAMVYVASALLS